MYSVHKFMRLNHKTAIITGAANGIGSAISKAFAEEGAWVLLVDLDAEGGEAVVAELRGAGGSAEFLCGDVSDPETANAAAERALRSRGRLDILCNNAAFLSSSFHGVLDSSEEEWKRSVDVTLMGTHYFTRAVLPTMVDQRAGSIINVASIQGMVGCMTSVAYTSMKSALLGYTRSAAFDYGPHNIRVNALCPGAIQTRIAPEPGGPHHKWQCENTMLGRVGQAREVGLSALFLASDDSSYVTGVTLPVDGGWTAR
jgi:NAD(P)-dependent dehydrogenase (short-subunit alcohol dehydrogenase family)